MTRIERRGRWETTAGANLATCKYHRDRPAIGICMRCRAAICGECCTRVDGINHCHACLRVLGRRAEPRRRSRALGALVALLFVVLGWAVFFGVLWQARGQLAP